MPAAGLAPAECFRRKHRRLDRFHRKHRDTAAPRRAMVRARTGTLFAAGDNEAALQAFERQMTGDWVGVPGASSREEAEAAYDPNPDGHVGFRQTEMHDVGIYTDTGGGTGPCSPDLPVLNRSSDVVGDPQTARRKSNSVAGKLTAPKERAR